MGEEFFLALDRIRTLCQENGIRFVICRQQAKSLSVRRDDLRGLTYAQERERVQQTLDADGELPPPSVWFLAHARIMERVPEWAERTGAGYADGIGALDENRDQLLSWVHLSPRGNEILADALADELLRAFTMPCETPTESDR